MGKNLTILVIGGEGYIGSHFVNLLRQNTAQVADACVIIPQGHLDRITPQSEAFQAVVWHLLVSDPRLKQVQTKWESVSTK